MNIFKKSRKAKDDEDALGASAGNEGQPFAKASRALTRKKKKQEVEEKPLFDLSSALPDNKDFRTSLLMPNLSARFSMLREQDDPNTKVGKASDDSVLHPKRASRLNVFNNNYLTDIAEVESIHSTFRPPFADDDHKGSISDGYASDDGGSMMNRSRPGETNNLFGGRQKLYKITTGSSTGLTGGKHMYEGDVALSAFQQFRLKEKEQRELDERTDRSSLPATEPEENESTRSPLTGFSQNRGTQSSTNSGPSNRPPSTAATSIFSESPHTQYHNNMPVNRVKELDANSSAESIGLATSPGFRKTKDNGASPKRLSQSRSAVNMRENYSRQSPIVASNVFRGMSPPLGAALPPLDFGLKDTSKPIVPPSRFQTASPTSHFDFDQDETLANNVRPNDWGKATAMGLFNKPARHYDEAQFSQRQMQMHEGRNSPMSNTSRSASRASPDSARPGRPSYASTTSPPPEDAYTPQIPPIPDHPASPASNRRSSANSTGRRSSSRPRAKSSALNKEAAVKARIESLIKKQNAELAALEVAELGPSRSHGEDDDTAVTSPSKSAAKGTFFDNSDDSEDEASQRRPSTRSTRSHVPPAPAEVHPALREGLQDFNFGTEALQPSFPSTLQFSGDSKTPQSVDQSRQSAHESVSGVERADSMTIPNAGLGLSGLIRTHLRHDSDKSSMLAPPSPALPTEDSRGSMASTTRTITESVKSDPFEFDNDRLNAPQPAQPPPAPITPMTAMSEKAQHILGIATAIRDARANAENTPRPEFSHESDMDAKNVFNSTIDEPSHQRNESTETQREQQRFEEELAARRKRIDENLQNVQERSRSRSPIGERHGGNTGHGFSLPRFPGRSNTGDRSEQQGPNKAMKMLGISSGPRDQPSPRPHAEPRFQDSERPRNGPRPPTAQDHDRPSGRQTPTSRPPYRPAPGHDRPPPPRSTTPSSKPGGRNRSNSAATGHSTSRNRHIPDFDPSTMPGGFPGSPRMRGSPPREYAQRSESPAYSRPYERSGSSAAGQYPDRAGYFASKPLGVPEMGNAFIPRASPRPSPSPAVDSFHQQQPMTPMSPSSALPSPNPAAVGFSNGRSTPTNLPGRATPSGTRKKSVTKGMISEPKFVSSTSSVPLVHLPRDGGPSVDLVVAPPVPAMNPRRRGYTAEEQQSSGFGPHPAVRPHAPQAMESPMSADFQVNSSQVAAQPRQRNRLRKSSSEGGNMAARARQQALMVEMAREKDRSPNVAVFPNRSATSLAVSQQGGMF